VQFKAYRAVRDFLRRENCDLVHAHMPISGLIGRVAARAAGVQRIAYTSHGFLFNQPAPWWRRSLALLLELAAGRITDIYLTVSEEEAVDARRRRIHLDATPVLNGRCPAQFHADTDARQTLRTELGAAEDDCVIIAVSRLVRHKGYPELLRAMELTSADVRLWVVGERLASDHGEDIEPFFARAAATLGPRLLRLGYRHDVSRLLAAADIFCLPSHFEGLSMSVIEAMLTGLPVVATDIRGTREQVVSGTTGLLVPSAAVAPLAEALSRLAADAALRNRMGEAARARAMERFDEAKMVTHTLDLLGL
jgi:glycosyltransferase involved in cell wall biosynthesis